MYLLCIVLYPSRSALWHPTGSSGSDFWSPNAHCLDLWSGCKPLVLHSVPIDEKQGTLAKPTEPRAPAKSDSILGLNILDSEQHYLRISVKYSSTAIDMTSQSSDSFDLDPHDDTLLSEKDSFLRPTPDSPTNQQWRKLRIASCFSLIFILWLSSLTAAFRAGIQHRRSARSYETGFDTDLGKCSLFILYIY